ncbi:MAG: M48 family metallopeptidase, partial [bacterium]
LMDLNYQIVRSAKRKRLTITVERDRSIIVHAPEGATDEAIRKVVETKRQWLFDKVNHAQKYQDRPHAPGKEVVNGESVPYLGREYLIEIAETKSGGVEFSRRFLIPAAQQAKRRKVLKEWYVNRATETILPRVIRHARELGVEFGEVK